MKKIHFVMFCLLMVLSVLISVADGTVQAEAFSDPALSDKYVEVEKGAYFNEESGVTLFGEYDVDGNWVPQSRAYTDNEGREVYESPDESGNWVPKLRIYTDNEGREVYETPDESGNWVPNSRSYEDDKGRVISESPDENGNWVLTGFYFENGQWITTALRFEGEIIETGYFDDIACSCTFYWGDQAFADSQRKNEIDLILTKGFQSIIAECKATADLTQDYFHKLNTISDLFGINARKALIANTYSSNPDRDRRNQEQISRGELMDIVTINKKEDISKIGARLASLMKRY